MKTRTLRTVPWAQGPLVLGVLALGLLAIPGVWNSVAGQGPSPWGADATRRNEGAIRFQLTPRGVEDGHFRVDIRVDTHSGDLSNLNLKKQLRLKAGGRSYSPVTDVRLGGHHSGGTLIFPLKEAPERFEIVILAVGTMGDLTFKWP